jgi:hypothetical protein
MSTAHEEEVGGVEMHEMDIIGPHPSSVAVASSLQPVPTGQDINEAQSVVPQAEASGASSILPCYHLIQR